MMNLGGLECFIMGVVLVGGLLALNYIMVSRQERREGKTAYVAPPINWEALQDTEIQDFMQRGMKINAIKRYRELTGVGLKEAKDAVDYAQAHPDEAEKKKAGAYAAPDAGVRDLIKAGKIAEAVEIYRQFAGVDEYTAKDAVWKIEQDMRYEVGAEMRLADGLTEDVINDPYIQSLVLAGSKIEAIKEYRQRTGLGLKDAKDAVDALEKQLKG